MNQPRQLLVAVLLLVAFFCPVITAAEKPNLILFLVDDMGWMDCGANGSSYYETPHIDALARRGMRFTAATVHPMCSPTRAALMSGQYSARHGLTAATGQQPPQPEGFAFMPKTAPASQAWIHPISKNYLDASQITLAEVLRSAGYRTGHFGKWHLGLEERHWPEAQGFDTAFHCHPDPGPPGYYFSPYGVVPPRAKHGKEDRVGTITDGLPGEYIVDRLAAEAARFIDENKDRPFFLNLWQYGVHGPWGAKEDDVKHFAAKTDPSGRQGNPIMAAMLKSVDDSLGVVMAAVEKAGLADRTFILFLSDNGGNDHELPAADMARKAARSGSPQEKAAAAMWTRYAPGMTPTSNAPLKHGKGWLYEGGTRVPCIAAWLGHISPGTNCETPVSAVDVYPTFLALAGVTPDSQQKLDGMSLAPLLTGSGTFPERPVFNFFPHGNGAKPPGVTVRIGRLKLIRWFYTSRLFPSAHELYDLHADPGESRNLAAERPAEVQRLDGLIETFLRDTQALVPVSNPAFKTKPAPKAKP